MSDDNGIFYVIGVIILAIVCILFITGLVALKNNSDCKSLGFDYAKIEPLSKYKIQDGYMSCVETDNDYAEGKCSGRITYNIVKRPI